VGRLQSIQVLRFVAAALVVWCHASGNLAGGIGVDIFFVISGFIIAGVAEGRSAGDFLRDRLTRILPIYWICSLPWWFVAAHAGLIDTPRVLASITLWPVYDDIVRPFLKVGWTLSFELLFYAGIALTLLGRRMVPLLGVAYLLALSAAFATHAPIFRFVGNPIILEFAFGLLLHRLRWRSAASGIAALVVGLGAVAWFAYHGTGNLDSPGAVFDLSRPDRAILWGVPAALIVSGALRLEQAVTPAGLWRPLIYLGDASYSIYLTHLLMLEFLKPVMPWPAAMMTVIMLGAATHRYVEAPLLKRLRSRSPHLALASTE
jgi:exopolysaccharide production protein ExoZ